MRGRGIRCKLRLLVTSGPGMTPFTLEKSIFSPGRTRLAIRNLAHVLPDLGKETRKVSSGYTARLRPGLCNPSIRFASIIARFSTRLLSSRHPRPLHFRERDGINRTAPQRHKVTGHLG